MARSLLFLSGPRPASRTGRQECLLLSGGSLRRAQRNASCGPPPGRGCGPRSPADCIFGFWPAVRRRRSNCLVLKSRRLTISGKTYLRRLRGGAHRRCELPKITPHRGAVVWAAVCEQQAAARTSSALGRQPAEGICERKVSCGPPRAEVADCVCNVMPPSREARIGISTE